jgi:hypothetical protein
MKWNARDELEAECTMEDRGNSSDRIQDWRWWKTGMAKTEQMDRQQERETAHHSTVEICLKVSTRESRFDEGPHRMMIVKTSAVSNLVDSHQPSTVRQTAVVSPHSMHFVVLSTRPLRLGNTNALHAKIPERRCCCFRIIPSACS